MSRDRVRDRHVAVAHVSTLGNVHLFILDFPPVQRNKEQPVLEVERHAERFTHALHLYRGERADSIA
jgi:hypothetical protein